MSACVSLPLKCMLESRSIVWQEMDVLKSVTPSSIFLWSLLLSSCLSHESLPFISFSVSPSSTERLSSRLMISITRHILLLFLLFPSESSIRLRSAHFGSPWNWKREIPFWLSERFCLLISLHFRCLYCPLFQKSSVSVTQASFSFQGREMVGFSKIEVI